MRKTILIVALAFGMNVAAQTNITLPAGNTISGGSGNAGVITVDAFGNGNIILNDQTKINGNFSATGTTTTNGLVNNGNQTNTGVLYTGAGGSNLGLKVNGYAEVTQNLYVNGDQITYGTSIFKKSIQLSGNKITGVANGTNANDAVNKSQLDAEANRLDIRIDQTNTNVSNLDAKVNANYLQTAQDIETAKGKAIQASKTYTDQKTDALKNDLTLYTDNSVKESESRLNKRIDALELKIDNRFNSVMSYVGNEFEAVNNRIEGLGASMVALSAAATSQVYNADKPTNLNIGTGFYGRATAIAVGLSHYFNSQTKLSVNYASGTNTKNAVGIGAGFCF